MFVRILLRNRPIVNSFSPVWPSFVTSHSLLPVEAEKLCGIFPSVFPHQSDICIRYKHKPPFFPAKDKLFYSERHCREGALLLPSASAEAVEGSFHKNVGRIASILTVFPMDTPYQSGFADGWSKPHPYSWRVRQTFYLAGECPYAHCNPPAPGLGGRG